MEESPFGLTGLVGIPAAQRRNKQKVIQAICQQLQLYGEGAGKPVTVFYKDWAMEGFTATEYDQRAANDHPLYQLPSGKSGIWDGIVLFAGTETSDQYRGYVRTADAVSQHCKKAQPIGDRSFFYKVVLP